MSNRDSDILRSLRLSAGVTQAAVATALGTSIPYVSDLERGRRNLHAIQPQAFDSLVNVLMLDEDGDEARQLRDAVLRSFAEAHPWAAVLLDEIEGAGYPEALDESDPAARRKMALKCVATARRLGLRVRVEADE